MNNEQLFKRERTEAEFIKDEKDRSYNLNRIILSIAFYCYTVNKRDRLKTNYQNVGATDELPLL